MVNANLGPGTEMALRLQRIEQRLQALETAPVLQHASVTQSDGSIAFIIGMSDATGQATTEWQYGPGTPGATMTDGQWPPFMVIGQALSGGSFAGTALQVLRPDGSTSMIVGVDGLGVSDKNGTVLWSESESAAGGIKTPYLQLCSLVDSNTTRWPGTANGSWTTIAIGQSIIQQPQIYWQYQSYAPTGVTGDFRLTVGGTQVGNTWTATNNAFNNSAQVADIPPGMLMQTLQTITLDAQVSAGAGTVICMVNAIIGSASS